jgi:hypothetical protein
MRVKVLLFTAVLLLAIPSFADETWNFTNPGPCAPGNVCTADLGSNSATFFSSPGGIALTATAYELTTAGWTDNNSAILANHDLAEKEGTNENGLGLYGTSSNEIVNPYFIQLDLASLLALNPNPDITLSFSSVTGSGQGASEGWRVSLADTAGNSGTTLATGNAGTYSFVDTSRYVNISSITNDTTSTILLGSVSAPTPEPASMLLLGAGLLGVGSVRRKLVKR